MNYIRTLSAALLLVAVASSIASAGAGNRVGTSGASELLIPVGTRDIGMGGSTAATSSGIDALFWNPAAVANMNNSVGLYVSHMNYIADIGVDYGAVAANFEGLGVISLSIKSLAVGSIPVTTTANPDGTGQTFSPQFFTAGLTYSRRLSDRIAVGITGNLITERLGEVSASGFGFNIGVQYNNLASIEGLSIGVVVKNIGPQMTFTGAGLLNQASVTGQNRPPQFYSIEAASFELPSSIEFGLGYKKTFTGDNSVLLSTGFQSNNFSDDEYKLGLEYAYQDLFFVRGGYDLAQKESTDLAYIFGPTFGAGVHTSLGSTDITFDYAYRSVKVFSANHVFSVKLGF
ncbi:MAG TPA: PorV/PorQ family protein [Bacteroidota bacterium]|nr:PorV/PorQ family protein [Bacteroidota bacterium]